MIDLNTLLEGENTNLVQDLEEVDTNMDQNTTNADAQSSQSIKGYGRSSRLT